MEYETVMEQQKTAIRVLFLGFKRCQEDNSYVETKKVISEVISYLTFVRVLMVRYDERRGISENINYGSILEYFFIHLFA